ncbi:MAG: hypothetical protein ACFB50_15425 [Rubrobacteraceae bacterium]
MKLTKMLRWIGPAAIVYGLFLVVSDMSGMPMPLLDPDIVPAGSSVMGSGLILWALVMLLVGMIGLYARLTEGDATRKAADREAHYREWEFDDEEYLVEEFKWDAPEDLKEDELLVTHGSR